MQAFRTLVALVAFAAGLQTAQAQTSQDWPNRPVRLIVPFAAGGSTDVAARLVGDYLSRATGPAVLCREPCRRQRRHRHGRGRQERP